MGNYSTGKGAILAKHDHLRQEGQAFGYEEGSYVEWISINSWDNEMLKAAAKKKKPVRPLKLMLRKGKIYFVLYIS